MNRIVAAALFVIGLLGSNAADAQSQSQALQSLYGQGVHAFHAGQLDNAMSSFSEAIRLGTRDPRVYYFRGLAQSRQGNQTGATADFSIGAQLEMSSTGRSFSVGRSLERIQGQARMDIERARTNARIATQRNNSNSLTPGNVVDNSLPVIPDPVSISGQVAPVQTNFPDVRGVQNPGTPFADSMPSETATNPNASTLEDPFASQGSGNRSVGQEGSASRDEGSAAKEEPFSNEGSAPREEPFSNEGSAPREEPFGNEGSAPKEEPFGDAPNEDPFGNEGSASKDEGSAAKEEDPFGDEGSTSKDEGSAAKEEDPFGDEGSTSKDEGSAAKEEDPFGDEGSASKDEGSDAKEEDPFGDEGSTSKDEGSDSKEEDPFGDEGSTSKDEGSDSKEEDPFGDEGSTSKDEGSESNEEDPFG